MHPVAVEFDLVQPLIAFRGRELGELGRDPFRRSRRARRTRYRPRHVGGGNGLLPRRTRLLGMVDFADMLGMIPLPHSWPHPSSRARLPPTLSQRENWNALASPKVNVPRVPGGCHRDERGASRMPPGAGGGGCPRPSPIPARQAELRPDHDRRGRGELGARAASAEFDGRYVIMSCITVQWRSALNFSARIDSRVV